MRNGVDVRGIVIYYSIYIEIKEYVYMVNILIWDIFYIEDYMSISYKLLFNVIG